MFAWAKVGMKVYIEGNAFEESGYYDDDYLIMN
jgi:hypothetical protein